MKYYSIFGGLILAAAFSLASTAGAQTACTETGFWVDGINMTAAEINPGNVTGTVDGTGCNVAIYYNHTGSGGTVNAAEVSGSNYFGVLVNGTGGAVAVNVTNSSVHDIGEVPQNGAQHGNAVFYINGGTATGAGADDSRSCGTGAASGAISGNTVAAYQKNGITVKCPGVLVSIAGNIVTGAGAVDVIAQNGIEVGVGAVATVSGNTVNDNEYTGTNNADSAGILIFGGVGFGAVADKEHVVKNALTDNDIGIDSINCGDANCAAPKNPTNNILRENTLSKADVSNISGCGGTQGYQAGITDLGRNDQIDKNVISGAGYTSNSAPCTGTGSTPALFSIDTTGSNSKVHKNNVSP